MNPVLLLPLGTEHGIHEFGNRGDAEFDIDVLDVSLDCALGDEEQLLDVRTRLAVHEQLHNLQLTIGQPATRGEQHTPLVGGIHQRSARPLRRHVLTRAPRGGTNHRTLAKVVRDVGQDCNYHHHEVSQQWNNGHIDSVTC